MEALELGAKIRGYRKEKGLSIQALAEQVHITPSMLSQIERDLANPSINTLKLLSNALNVPLFQFFTSSGSKEESIVRKNERKKIRTSSKNISYEYELLKPDTNGDIEFVIQKFKANSDSGGAVQSHDGEEVSYVLKGRLTLWLDQSEFTLEAGDSVRIPAMTPHLWVNQTDEDATLIYAITPPCF